MVQTPSTADPEITACPCPTLPRAIRQRQPGSSSSAREAGSATPALGAESEQQKTCLLGDEHSTRCSCTCTSLLRGVQLLSQCCWQAFAGCFLPKIPAGLGCYLVAGQVAWVAEIN